MTLQAGQLLLARQHLTLQDGITPVNTGLQQVNLGLSPDPPVGGTNPSAGDPGVASRVEVRPLAPLDIWNGSNIHHGEPYLQSGTVWVDFWVAAGTGPAEINVLFWDPHTVVTPMDADPYNTFSCLQAAPTGGTASGGSNDHPANAGDPFTANNNVATDGQLILAVFGLYAFGDWANPVSDPVLTDAGWTTIATGGVAIGGAGDGLKFIAAYRFADTANDPATWGFDSGGAGWRGAAMVRGWSPSTPAAPIQSVSSVASVAVPVDPLLLAAPSIDAPAGALPTMVSLFVASSYGFFWSAPPGMSSLGQVKSSSANFAPGVTMLWAEEAIAAAGPTGTRTATLNNHSLATAAGVAFSFALPPTCGVFPDGTSP